MLKRAGRGHDPSGVAGTSPGECAVECPACPHPSKNLPDNWNETPKEKRCVIRDLHATMHTSHGHKPSWIYRLFIGLDANFRLKRKKRSNEQADPGLNKGYAYFVEDTKYKDFLDRFSDMHPHDPSTCHNHDAVKLANMKKFHELDASGVATVECTRHNMKRPCSVGDLQKGER